MLQDSTPASAGQWTRPARRSPLQALFASSERALLGSLTIIALLVAWEVLARLDILNPIFSSSPARIVEAGVKYFRSPYAWADIRATGSTFLYGFVIASVAGIIIGVLIGWYRTLEAMFDPLISFFYTSPRPVLVPLFIVWFGIGMESKLALVIVSTIFPMIIATFAGIRTVDRNLVNVARSFNATTGQIISTIVLPSTIPQIISGLRIGLGHALTAAVFGEMVVASVGIGHTMVMAANTFNTDLIFVGFILVGTFGMLLNEIIRRVENALQKWRPDLH